MKRCPECYHVYNDQEKFCEADGHELLADPAFSPKTEVVASASARPVWWPAAALGIVIGIVFGAGVFAAAMLLATPAANDRSVATPATAIPERALPNRVVSASNSVATPE